MFLLSLLLRLFQPTVHLRVTTRVSHTWTSHSISQRNLWPSNRFHSQKRSHIFTSLWQHTLDSTPPSPSPSPPATWSTRTSPRPPRTQCSPAQPSKPGSQLFATFTGKFLPQDTPPHPPPRPPCAAPPGDTATPTRGSRAQRTCQISLTNPTGGCIEVLEGGLGRGSTHLNLPTTTTPGRRATPPTAQLR